MIDLNKQPIILLGGFLINPLSYLGLANYLKKTEGIDVNIVNINKFEWLNTNWEFGWAKVLDKVDILVKEQVKNSNTGKITLIGHSSGGIMLRLYLSDKCFRKRVYDGKKYCNNLITLGSPHSAIRATKLRSQVDRDFPGSYYAEFVNYTSIGGCIDLKSKRTKLLARLTAENSYKAISGIENDIGDGLVPLSSSLLKDSKQIILKDVSHGKVFGEQWYGSEDTIKQWWQKLT